MKISNYTYLKEKNYKKARLLLETFILLFSPVQIITLIKLIYLILNISTFIKYMDYIFFEDITLSVLVVRQACNKIHIFNREFKYMQTNKKGKLLIFNFKPKNNRMKTIENLETIEQ